MYNNSAFVLPMSSGRIQQRIDPTLQKRAEAILKAMGLKPAQVITMLYREITRRRTLPFHPSEVSPSEIPNARLQKDIREARAGKGVQEFETEEEFFASLKKL